MNCVLQLGLCVRQSGLSVFHLIRPEGRLPSCTQECARPTSPILVSPSWDHLHQRSSTVWCIVLASHGPSVALCCAAARACQLAPASDNPVCRRVGTSSALTLFDLQLGRGYLAAAMANSRALHPMSTKHSAQRSATCCCTWGHVRRTGCMAPGAKVRATAGTATVCLVTDSFSY